MKKKRVVTKAKAPAKPAEVKVTPAKGRPMLVWVGKRPLKTVTAFPAQHVETCAAGSAVQGDWTDWPSAYPKGGLLFHGDNKEVLAHLLANGFRGKVNLIYIDPPFDSGADYVRKVSLRGAKGSARIDGEAYALGEEIQYADIWASDSYLQFMYERLLVLKELLKSDGTLYLHCDWHRNYQLRSVLDEVFGAEHLVSEIVWQRTFSRAAARAINNIHDTIFVYSKGEDFTWNDVSMPVSDDYLTSRFTMVDDKTGDRFQGIVLTAPGLSGGETGKPWRGINPSEKGRHWSHRIEELERLDAEGLIYWPPEGGQPRRKSFARDVQGVALQSLWTDIPPVNSQATEDTGFPTQKPVQLLERILACSSRPGDIVLDCFVGSGTTSAAAQKHGRRWIACDINKGATQATAKRLQTMIADQDAGGAQRDLGVEGETAPKPAQLGFTVWRVNDYDLQIQHNEAANLAVELLGVERTRTDGYFDGTLGKALVKIAPFTHPLTPLDLEDLKRELEARPDEDRPVTVVCLGIEVAAQAWVDEWNALRRGAAAVNKIQVIELRTDPTYGKFIRHEPARAKVKIERKKDAIRVEIQDFISPTIVERLGQQAGVLSPRIDDWRAMVDSVMIDPAYDGQVFNVALSDVPARKQDLVKGIYELRAPSGKTTVAVKVTDMLGEEVLVTKEV